MHTYISPVPTNAAVHCGVDQYNRTISKFHTGQPCDATKRMIIMMHQYTMLLVEFWLSLQHPLSKGCCLQLEKLLYCAALRCMGEVSMTLCDSHSVTQHSTPILLQVQKLNFKLRLPVSMLVKRVWPESMQYSINDDINLFCCRLLYIAI